MFERPLLVIGDSLLDRDLDGVARRLSPEAPVAVVEEPRRRSRPGGAALAAVIACRSGRQVRLITALGDDRAGRELKHLLEGQKVDLMDLQLSGGTRQKTRIRVEGRTLLRVDSGAASPCKRTVELGPWLRQAAAILVSDYGGGLPATPFVREALAEAQGVGIPIVWDPHPQGAVPLPQLALVTPNRAEAGGFDTLGELTAQAARLVREWRARAVAVTLGARGAMLAEGQAAPRLIPAPAVPVLDPCGAGDCFAATAAAVLAGGGTVAEAVAAAVFESSHFLAEGGVAGLFDSPRRWSEAATEGMERALAIVAEVRQRGGTVVATGGCFDLLHAGHLRVLSESRGLGDCLVVCLNSDASVARLKGRGRPVVPEGDRAAILAQLRCVDAVVVFDEDTPGAVLRRLRPDLFTKGADYAEMSLPERELVRSWGGEVVLLPLVEGRSTTRLLEAARRGN